jgi:hypothetical protein
LSFVEKKTAIRGALLSLMQAVIGASRLNSGRCASAFLLLSLAAIGIAPAQNTMLPASTIFRCPWTSGDSDDQPPTSSSDGRTVLFQRSDGHGSKIFESHLIDGRWSTPAVASFSGSWSDQFPAMSPDGSYLIFESDRPFTAGGGSADRIGNLWRVDRTASGWAAPVHLPESVNISMRIYGHSVAANGDIYFMSTTEPRGKDPKWRLFRAVRMANGYAQAQALPFSDGSTSDVDPYVAPDQSYLIFSSEKRRQPTGHEHLFIAFHSGADWGPVVPIRYSGDEQAEDDNYSDVSADGKTLYFVSTTGDKSIVRTLPLAPYLLAAGTSGSKP